jgi:glycosyltransferase involved in cell wall biosynthesis
MNKKNIHIIFWGELTPNTINGISISNTTILNILKEKQKNVIIIEEYSWKMNSLRKIIHYLNSYFKLVYFFFCFKFNYFYFMLPPSKFGLLKLAFLLPVLKIIQPSTVLIAHVHRGDTQLFYEQSFINRYLLKFVFRFIDKLITLSPVFKEQLHAIGFSKEIVFLRNTSPFENHTNNNKKKFDSRFVSITNYIKTKGIIELVKAFSDKDMSYFKLDTFGETYENETFHIITTIKSTNTEIHKSLSRENFVETIKKFDALILPSWNEGQPIIIIEAMSLGIPVIASDVGDIRNMLGDNYPFIFPAKDIELMKTKIKEFVNFSKKNEISEMLKARYIQYFSNEKYKTEIIQIFQ